MINLNVLKNLRTKEKLLLYLQKKCKREIKEAKIESFKKRFIYEDKNNLILSTKQLEKIIGGEGTFHIYLVNKNCKIDIGKFKFD